MNTRISILIMLIALSASCSDGGKSENVFQTQIDAVDKAKEVEGQILDAASQQQQAVEEQSQ